MITADLQSRLWPFMGGIARENGMKALAIGGVEDHAHLLLSLPATISLAKAIQQIKGASCKWVHDTFPEHRLFGWQEGYGAFSSIVPTGRNNLPGLSGPSDESLGYCRLSLRDVREP